LTTSIDAIRANMPQCARLAQIVPQLAILAAWTVVCFALALMMFRWR
jgi:ABC-2 type transport system permease protein